MLSIPPLPQEMLVVEQVASTNAPVCWVEAALGSCSISSDTNVQDVLCSCVMAIKSMRSRLVKQQQEQLMQDASQPEQPQQDPPAVVCKAGLACDKLLQQAASAVSLPVLRQLIEAMKGSQQPSRLMTTIAGVLDGYSTAAATEHRDNTPDTSSHSTTSMPREGRARIQDRLAVSLVLNCQQLLDTLLESKSSDNSSTTGTGSSDDAQNTSLAMMHLLAFAIPERMLHDSDNSINTSSSSSIPACVSPAALDVCLSHLGDLCSELEVGCTHSISCSASRCQLSDQLSYNKGMDPLPPVQMAAC